MLTKERIRDYLRKTFDIVTVRLERDHRDGLRILVKRALRHRLLVGTITIANLFAVLFEGGTIGILSIAASVLVGNGPAHVGSKFGMAGPLIASWTTEIGRGGMFLVLVLTAVAAQVLMSGLKYLGSYLSIRLRFRVTKELQDLATRQAMQLSYAAFTRYPAGAVSALIDQAGDIGRLIVIFNTIALASFMFVVYIGVMLAMSIPLTLSAVGVIMLFGFSLIGVVSKLRGLGEQMVSSAIATGKLTFEYLQAPRLLRIFNATGFAEKSIRDARAVMLRSTEKSEAINAAIGPATNAITICGAGAFLIGGYFVAGQSAISVIPRLVVFVFVLNRLMPQVRNFNQARMALVNALPGVRRVANFLRKEDKVFSRLGGRGFSRLESGMRFENVSFRYPGSEVNAVSGISFTIPKGKTIALVGPSGAGKSTIADLLLGLYEPTEGRISVDGCDLRALNLEDWRANIGVVDQEILLLNTSVFKNITFAQEGYALEDARRAARAAHAHDFITSLPNGYDTEIGDRGYRLSGGQQQRLVLARALLKHPQLLILDEATSALDTQSERVIQNTLENLHHERTILIIAHRLSTLARADGIVVLQGGRVVERGTWKELMNEGGVFATLWNMQSVQHAGS